MSPDIILYIYRDARTVFKLVDIALLTGESNPVSLNRKLNYYVRTGKILNPRKGIYAKPYYSVEELVCILYTPSYISLEYVLQRTGVIFQYSSSLTAISYLSRELQIEEQQIAYRRLKDEILYNWKGIIKQDLVYNKVRDILLSHGKIFDEAKKPYGSEHQSDGSGRYAGSQTLCAA